MTTKKVSHGSIETKLNLKDQPAQRQKYEQREEAVFGPKTFTGNEALEGKVAELERLCGQLAVENAALKEALRVLESRREVVSSAHLTGETDKEQQRRLWEFRLHLNENYYNLLNFFIIFETVLLGVVGLVYGKSQIPGFALKMMILFGFSLTVIWWIIQARRKHLVDDLDGQIQAFAPEYKAFVERRKRSRWPIWPISSKVLLTHAVPALVALIWLSLLLFM